MVRKNRKFNAIELGRCKSTLHFIWNQAVRQRITWLIGYNAASVKVSIFSLLNSSREKVFFFTLRCKEFHLVEL